MRFEILVAHGHANFADQLAGRVETIRTEASRQQGATVILSGRDYAGVAMDFDADFVLVGTPISGATTAISSR